jgi:cytochrome c2
LRDKKMGPLLGGRRAGAPDTGLSRLASAALIWTSENLDQWLSDRTEFIAGARMPERDRSREPQGLPGEGKPRGGRSLRDAGREG